MPNKVGANKCSFPPCFKRQCLDPKRHVQDVWYGDGCWLSVAVEKLSIMLTLLYFEGELLRKEKINKNISDNAEFISR